MKYIKNKISLAPMVDRTDNNFRHFVRLISKNILLYTEMITDKAIINSTDKVLSFFENQNPIVLQLATNNKDEARRAIELSNKFNYDEININIGCPSDRISDNNMGAYLMSDVKLVKSIITEIKKVTDKPITVKHRIGIDGTGILENDAKYIGYDNLKNFIENLNEVGIEKFIVHARIAILKGLNPKQNRTIPPLDYDMVYNLKRDFPNLFIEINGGIKTIDDIKKHLNYVDSVMIGRALYDNPLLLLDIEKEIYNNNINISRKDILEKMINFFEYKKFDEKNIHRYIMHTHGLFLGIRGSNSWKRLCSNSKTNIQDIKNFIGEINE